MRSPLVPGGSALGPGPRRLGIALALVAVLLPVGCLLQAGRQAHEAVVDRVLVGQAATAQAVAVQVQQAWDHAQALARALPNRPSVQDALTHHDVPLLQRTVASMQADSPFTAITAYDATDTPWVSVGAPLGPLAAHLPPEQVAAPVVAGEDAVVRYTEPVVLAGERVGTVRLQLSLRAIVPDLSRLRYGRTGTTSIVDAAGRYLLAPDAVVRGHRLSSPVGLALAAAHRAGSVRLYSPRFHTRVFANYAPAGPVLGVLTRQFDSEAFAAADRLQQRLLLAAGGVLLVGLALVAAAVGLLRHYRRCLDQRDAELRGLVDRSRDIISRYQMGRGLIFVSPAVEGVLGWSSTDKLGTDPYDLVHPDDQEAYLAQLSRHDAQEDSVTQSFRMRHRDGSWVWVEATTVVDRAADGSVVAYNGVTRDITERQRDRAELAAARDAALQASVSKSVFLANTSHELRTPLNGILGLTEVLLCGDLDGRQREYAQTVQDSGRGLLTILDDILDLAKIEAGGMHVERVPFALAATVERAVAPFRPLAQARQVGLELRLDPSLPEWVEGDPTRLGQVLSNLVSNAVKFTAEGRIAVVVRPGPEPQVQVEVTDTGIGIPADALPTLFDSFTQADSSTTRRYGGTGLGLAVSRQLAELQGGTLEVVSTVDLGSTFTLRLPLPAAQPRHADAAAPPTATRPLRVLVAEDNPVNQLVVRSMLEQLGHRVVVVADGRAAVDAALSDPYDVVLMDCQMPVLDGYDATRAIREAQAGTRHVPVFGLSASAMTADRERALAAGMDRYLTKPIVLKELADALDGLRDPSIPAPRGPRPAPVRDSG